MPEDRQDRAVMDRLGASFAAFNELLARKNAELERVKKEKKEEAEALLREIERLKQWFSELKDADEATFQGLGDQLKELTEKIEALTSTPPIHVGKLICLVEDGRVVILDNHKVKYEVLLDPSINQDDLEEGSEVRYTVDRGGRPIGVFAVDKSRREEEIVKVEAVYGGENLALVILSGDTHKVVGIGRKVVGLEKGDDVYYDPAVCFITGKVPKKEEKIDLRHIQKKTWADIGGLSKEVKKVRDVAELPLRHPELFEQLGITRPKGILLSGPPGCGKTLIGKVLANETDAFFIHISGPEIIGSYVGESEAKLRHLFDAARKNAPAIVFLDEVEAIAEKREEAEHSHERRLVAQLLALMDGLASSEQVVVIAATNKPNLLDEALRRPGRFDREIEISVPDEEGRLEILKIHSAKMPLTKDVSLSALAKVTHGFTGADLEGLCREAGMRVLAGIDPDGLLPAKPEVAMEHFNAAFAEMKPSSMREITFIKPTETWADIGGLKDVKRLLMEAVRWPLLYPKLLKQAHQEPIRGVLLFGPPGCGKTLIAKALANECGVNFIPIKGPELLNKWVGESEANVRKIFKRARQSAPCIIFFDEIDALVSMRGMHSGDPVSDKVTAQLLTELDGIESLKGVFILAATNRIDLVDPALLRTGRFDHLIYLPPPDEEARLKIFEIHTKGRPLADDVDLAVLAKRAVLPAGIDVSGNVIKSICQKAGQKALREFVDTRDPEKEYLEFKIQMRHFNEAMEEILHSVKASAHSNKNILGDKAKDGMRVVESFTDREIDSMLR